MDKFDKYIVRWINIIHELKVDILFFEITGAIRNVKEQ